MSNLQIDQENHLQNFEKNHGILKIFTYSQLDRRYKCGLPKQS